jgi:hypothetical protein
VFCMSRSLATCSVHCSLLQTAVLTTLSDMYKLHSSSWCNIIKCPFFLLRYTCFPEHVVPDNCRFMLFTQSKRPRVTSIWKSRQNSIFISETSAIFQVDFSKWIIITTYRDLYSHNTRKNLKTKGLNMEGNIQETM